MLEGTEISYHAKSATVNTWNPDEEALQLAAGGRFLGWNLSNDACRSALAEETRRVLLRETNVLHPYPPILLTAVQLLAESRTE